MLTIKTNMHGASKPIARRKPNIENPVIAKRKPTASSKITNGARLLMADGRSPWSRRYRDIVAAHCSDLGGYENQSAAKLAIIRRCATLQVELEAQESRLASGDSKGFSLVEFSQVSNGLRRLLETIGLEIIAKDVTPSIADIVALHNNDASFVEARAEQEHLDELQEEGRDTRTDEPVESQEAEQSPLVDSNSAHARNLPTDDSVRSNTNHGSHLPEASNVSHAKHSSSGDSTDSNVVHGQHLPASDDESRLPQDCGKPKTERAP